MSSDIKLAGLTCEYLENPFGIDTRRPRLSWQLVSERPEVLQTAWQVQVHEDDNLLWDSGMVESEQSTLVTYAGPTLRSRQRCIWRVRVWTGDETPTAWSETAGWEMGLLQTEDWQARWIDPEDEIDPKAFKPAPYLRRDFEFGGPVRSARLYATAQGLYELWLNGRRVGDRMMTPGWSAYHTRLEFQTYDVTDLLQPGDNSLGAILGDGWWRGKVSIDSQRNTYGERLALLLQLEVTLADGSVVVVCSDADWRTRSGPILKSDWKDGEVYDARLELPGWCKTGYDERDWHPVRVVDHPRDHLAASIAPPVRKMERFTPQLLKSRSGQTILDFGQNISGHVQYRVQGPAGTTVKLTHVEALDREGDVAPAQTFLNMDRLLQEVHYTLRGGAVEEYAPRFTSQGFRYVRLEGWPGEPQPEDFEAVAIYSDMPASGHFSCSNPALNQLHSNVLWSMKGNFMDIPTDCPTRERAGWTGDAQVFARAGATLMHCAGFFTRWLQDLAAEQKPDGMVPNLIPNPYHAPGKGNFLITATAGSAGWADAAIMLPWALYQCYGDCELVARQYDSMRAWYGFMRQRSRQTHWVRRFSPRSLLSPQRRRRLRLLQDRGYHWGEWLEPGNSMPAIFAGLITRMLFSCPSVASAYHKHSADLMAQIAGLLGHADEAQTYRDEAAAIRSAWAAEFIAADGSIRPDTQASYVRALAFDLAPGELRARVLQQLLRKISEADNHVGTGFLATGMLCEVLAAEGHADLAWELLLQESDPSWLYAIDKGATTIWESWDAVREDGSTFGSHNHYSKGVVAEFLYRRVAGIEIAAPGYQRILFQPAPGGGLTQVQASIQTMYGEVASAWQLEEGRFRLEVRIPPNTRAEIRLPDGSAPLTAGSGRHDWSCKLREND